MWKISMCFLRPGLDWNLRKLLKLMFTTLVLPVATVFSLYVTCFLIIYTKTNDIHNKICSLFFYSAIAHGHNCYF